MLPDIIMSVEMLVITDAVEESGMQALMGKQSERGQLEDLGKNVRIILKWKFQEI
jgi:ketol-acid reductoisomerase